jgi:hypothetical protein
MIYKRTVGRVPQCHRQISSYMTVELTMPFGSLMNHYIGVIDYGLGSAPRLAYRDSEKMVRQGFNEFRGPHYLRNIHKYI